MRSSLAVATLCLFLATPAMTRGEEFNPSNYREIAQANLAGDPQAYAGRKFTLSDSFQFAGSDFCVQIQKTKFNTRDYFCFALGSPALVRLYLKKDHPQTELLLSLRQGTKVRVYGTFDFMGTNYRYLVVDHLELEKTR